ncbi:MAG: hypothetical protein ABIP55_06995 [Tepidisphaeraceae bacterium]
MRLMGVFMMVAVAASSVCGATTQTTGPATTRSAASAARPAPDAARLVVRAAVAALTREYEQYLRDPRSAPVRANATYFRDQPPATELSADAIAQALLAGGQSDPRVGAYVKWQLLSGLSDSIDEATAKQLVAAYRTAPRPMPRPGISGEDQQRLDGIVRGAKMEDEPNFIEAIDRAVNDVRRDNTPILAYRDELYRRLPKAPETFAAAMDDLVQRLATEAEGKELVKTLVKDAREWSATVTATPQTLAILAKAARRLADTKGPQYYTTPYWNDRSGGFAWRKTRANIDSARSLKDLAVYLEEQSQKPAIDLTIK